MSKTLVIVESPTKAKTIGKFLGKDYIVTSSNGHIRDLPRNASEVPAKMKTEKWTRLGVNVAKKFKALYVVATAKKKTVKELKKKLAECDELLLATDEDREGESISWHLLEVLKPKVPVKRLVFHEITKKAIAESLANTREVDMSLVRAQETRRIIDRLFGYEISPVLWRKMAPKLSAGRVQSVATRLLVQKERERMAFKSANFWGIQAELGKEKIKFNAELITVDGKRVCIGKDFDQNTGKLIETNKDNKILIDEKKAKELVKTYSSSKALVNKVESKPFTSKPYPPFTTSTLQQEASRKLRFAAKHTMRVAQKLYENGFITYMRTDSTTLSNQAVDAARDLILNEYGKEYMPKSPRIYKTKVKNAQEAHEAIRPAGDKFQHPEIVKEALGEEQFKLYDLIWKRTIACQMENANGTRVRAEIKIDNGIFRASGKTILFPGFLKAYVEGSDDPQAELADKEKILPKMTEGENVDISKINPTDHNTKPPARYTEGSLIRELERLGIGRPSTWASVVDTVLKRGYSFKKGPALVPTFLAMALTNLMEQYFTKFVDYSFTASLEDDLDGISRGEVDSIEYLSNFYHGEKDNGLKKSIDTGIETIDARLINGIKIADVDGVLLEVRVGRYGSFISFGETTASIMEDIAPDELTEEKALEIIKIAAAGPQSLGEHPETGKPVYFKTGRYGPYLQLGDPEEVETTDKKGKVKVKTIKPKMASLFANMSPDDVDLELALKLLSLPFSLGTHPVLKADVMVNNGRFGPYLKCGDENRSIPMKEFDPLTMTLDQAVELMARPKLRGRTSSAPVKIYGKHPKSEKELVLKNGKYGPYVTDGKINVSVPKDIDPQKLELEKVIEMIDNKEKK